MSKCISSYDACGGFDTLSHINEIGLPKTLRELGIEDKSILPEIAQSCNISVGNYRQLTHEEILDILNECYYYLELNKKC